MMAKRTFGHCPVFYGIWGYLSDNNTAQSATYDAFEQTLTVFLCEESYLVKFFL